MSKSKSTTLESPPKFLQDKPGPRPEMPPPSPPEYSVVPVTDERILEQYRLIEEAEDAVKARMNVLAGMVTMVKPALNARFDYEKRAFLIPVGEEDEESDEQTGTDED